MYEVEKIGWKIESWMDFSKRKGIKEENGFGRKLIEIEDKFEIFKFFKILIKLI